MPWNFDGHWRPLCVSRDLLVAHRWHGPLYMLLMIVRMPFFTVCLEFAEGQLIAGGNFNIPLSPLCSSGLSSVCPGIHNPGPTQRPTDRRLETTSLWRKGLYLLFLPSSVLENWLFSCPPHSQLEAVNDPVIGAWSDHVWYCLLLSDTPSQQSRPPELGFRSWTKVYDRHLQFWPMLRKSWSTISKQMTVQNVTQVSSGRP